MTGAALFPAPASTPVIGAAGRFSDPWMRYTKVVGDSLLTASSLANGLNGVKYALTCETIQIWWTRPTATVATITLPFKSLVPFEWRWSDGTSQWFPSGTDSVPFNSSAEFGSATYFINRRS